MAKKREKARLAPRFPGCECMGKGDSHQGQNEREGMSYKKKEIKFNWSIMILSVLGTSR